MRRVAVIAVHGVGSPPRFATARSVAELLMKKTATDAYSPFEERFVTIPTARLDAGNRRRTRENRKGFERVKETFTEIANDRTQFADAADAAHQPDIAFMREQLRDYKSDNTPYTMVEIVGTRGQGPQAAEVHIFEMHWADLSRLGDGLLRILGAIYQLVLHVSHLGRKAIDVAAHVATHRKDTTGSVESPAAHAWKQYGVWHAAAVRIFTTLVPVATVVMLAFVPFFVPAGIAAGRRLLVGAIAALLLAIVGGGLSLYFRGPERNAAGAFVVFTFAAIAAGVGLVANVEDPSGVIGTVLLTAVIAVGVGLGLWTLLGRYGRSRPGVRPYGVVVAAAVLAATWFARGDVLDHSRGFDDAERVRLLAFLALQVAWIALMVTWAVLWVTVFGAIRWRIAVARRTTGTERRRGVRAIWTARVTLAATVFSFIVFSLVAYQSMVFLADKASAKFKTFPVTLDTGRLPVVNERLVAPKICPPAGGECVADPLKSAPALFTRMIARSGTSGFVLALAGCVASLIMISWFIALVAVTSIKAPDPVKNARRLGLWMTQGFWWMRKAGSLLAYVLLFAILGGLVVDFGLGGHLPDRTPDFIAALVSTEATRSLVSGLAVAALAGAVTFGTARVRVEMLTSKARPALGIMLDVDNYLRESPDDGTPRARIAERFVSLLRYINNRRFDSIVLVSHSQGTVITADLLRFLHAEQPAEAALISPDRVQLITMGSPLRQLYAANFPHLYEWVDRSDDSDTPLANGEVDPDHAATIDGRSPDPASLNVGRWVNLYTTGDYVGRNLWHRDDWARVWERQESGQATVADRRRERCLGAGTHTKYWESADVADEIDRLIGESGGVAMTQQFGAYRRGPVQSGA